MPWSSVGVWQKACVLDGSRAWGVPAVGTSWWMGSRAVLPEGASPFSRSSLGCYPPSRLGDQLTRHQKGRITQERRERMFWDSVPACPGLFWMSHWSFPHPMWKCYECVVERCESVLPPDPAIPKLVADLTHVILKPSLAWETTQRNSWSLIQSVHWDHNKHESALCNYVMHEHNPRWHIDC